MGASLCSADFYLSFMSYRRHQQQQPFTLKLQINLLASSLG